MTVSIENERFMALGTTHSWEDKVIYFANIHIAVGGNAIQSGWYSIIFTWTYWQAYIFHLGGFRKRIPKFIAVQIAG